MNDYHPRISRANLAILLRYEADHPAVHALQIHAEACDICVGKEIEWAQLGNRAIDQTWFSRVRLKNYQFSSFAYEFLSYDLTLDGWLVMPLEPTEAELNHLEDDDPLMRALLTECEEAALDDGNEEILPLISKAWEFLTIYKKALLYRFKKCGISWPVQESEANR